MSRQIEAGPARLRGVAAALAAGLLAAVAIAGAPVRTAPGSPGARTIPVAEADRPAAMAGHHVTGRRGVVAADHAAASEAGAAMLRRGGNAVDAAVAASFTLSVVRPDSCGIGGGGFMLVHVPAAGDRPAATHALDYRETAAAAVGPDYFVRLRTEGRPDDVSRTGVHAVGVPGTVAGLLLAHDRWGRLTRADVLEPAIRAARDGWIADAHTAGMSRAAEARIAGAARELPGAEWIRERLARFGEITPGTTMTNPQQARALELIAAGGADAFYRGPIAEAITAVMEARGEPVTRADLAAYAPRDLDPLVGRHGDRTVLTFPPPSSGGLAILQVLGILERLETAHGPAGGPDDPASLHRLAEAMKHAFADRARWLADPDFAEVPVDRLLDAANLDRMAARVRLDATLATDDYGTAPAPPEDAGTSHVSVIDAEGMAVACTETINTSFGSFVPVPGFGFVLNNEMDDFTTVPGAGNAYGLRQSDANLPHPGQRPLSSMSPTIVLDPAGAVEAVVGASGGPRIITGTLQVLLHALDPKVHPADAVLRPRIHHQWRPERLDLEPGWARAAVPPNAGLAERGHVLGTRGEVGNVQLVLVRRGVQHAVSDPRKGGRPAAR